jgi:streptogramin lyase
MDMKHGDSQFVGPEAHKPARPMKVVVTEDGSTWLCDKAVDENRDLRTQGCWSCGDVPFTRND